LEEAVVELEARGEVEEFERPGRPAEDGAEDVRVLDVLLVDLGGVHALDLEYAALHAVEQRAEDEARVRPRPAQPLDRAFAEERAVRAVADDAEAVCHAYHVRGHVGCTYRPSGTRRGGGIGGAAHRTWRPRDREQSPAGAADDRRRQVRRPAELGRARGGTRGDAWRRRVDRMAGH